MDHLWSPWRYKYLTTPAPQADGCVFCGIHAKAAETHDEANLVVHDTAFAAILRARIDTAVAAGVVIAPEDFAHIGRLERIWYGAAYFLYSGVLRLVTLGKYS